MACLKKVCRGCICQRYGGAGNLCFRINTRFNHSVINRRIASGSWDNRSVGVIVVIRVAVCGGGTDGLLKIQGDGPTAIARECDACRRVDKVGAYRTCNIPGHCKLDSLNLLLSKAVVTLGVNIGDEHAQSVHLMVHAKMQVAVHHLVVLTGIGYNVKSPLATLRCCHHDGCSATHLAILRCGCDKCGSRTADAYGCGVGSIVSV